MSILKVKRRNKGAREKWTLPRDKTTEPRVTYMKHDEKVAHQSAVRLRTLERVNGVPVRCTWAELGGAKEGPATERGRHSVAAHLVWRGGGRCLPRSYLLPRQPRQSHFDRGKIRVLILTYRPTTLQETRRPGAACSTSSSLLRRHRCAPADGRFLPLSKAMNFLSEPRRLCRSLL